MKVRERESECRRRGRVHRHLGGSIIKFHGHLQKKLKEFWRKRKNRKKGGKEEEAEEEDERSRRRR